MKADIHPKYQAVKFNCSCGNEFTVNSTLNKEKVVLDVCNKCHPFYTGKQKIAVTGNVEKFRKRFENFMGKEETS